MTTPTQPFVVFLHSWFGLDTEPDLYIEACESMDAWLTRGDDRIPGYRDELAAHLRDSSYPPLPHTSQWETDEWLRDTWYDAFGPEPTPGDAYPVPAADWGHVRLTPYMLHAVDEDPEQSSDGAPAWLERRGLTPADVDAAVSLPADQAPHLRPAPDDWFDHLRRLTDDGRRDALPGETASS